MPNNKDLPAYPHLNYEGLDNGVGMFTESFKPGISQRTLIAAMCLQGFRSNPFYVEHKDSALWEWAQHDADGLLAHLQNTDK